MQPTIVNKMASAKRSRTRMSPTSRMTDVEPSFLEAKNSILHVVEESMGEKVSTSLPYDQLRHLENVTKPTRSMHA